MVILLRKQTFSRMPELKGDAHLKQDRFYWDYKHSIFCRVRGPVPLGWGHCFQPLPLICVRDLHMEKFLNLLIFWSNNNARSLLRTPTPKSCQDILLFAHRRMSWDRVRDSSICKPAGDPLMVFMLCWKQNVVLLCERKVMCVVILC